MPAEDGRAMKPELLAVFKNDGPRLTPVEWMNRSSFDELIEIDVGNDHCRNLYHVKGKYHVPVYDSTYSDLHSYAIEHMVHPDDRDVFVSLMEPSTLLQRLAESDTPGVIGAQFRYKLQSGDWRWTEEIVLGGPEHGLPEGIVHCYVFDIQNQKDREFGKVLSNHFDAETERDDLTRLLWEKPFANAANDLMGRIGGDGWCIVAIDLEYFRLLNDWYGRETGDLLLARIGEELARVEKETGGVAGYLGQDDFALMVPYDEASFDLLYARLTDLVDNITQTMGFRFLFGVARIEEGASLLDVADHAKIALEMAGKDVNQSICVYSSEMAERSNREYQVLLDFKDALQNDEFEIYLQPQCRVSTGKVMGAEVLARWRKPDGSLVSPIDFIPVLERHGFITDLDLFVWEKVCAKLRAWIDGGHEAVPVSVNVSQVDVLAIDVPEFLADLTEKYGIPPELLKVEITESAFADSAEAVRDMVDRLHEKGFIVLMDDFGSGYSSLNVLSSINVDVIKLDADFLRMEDAGKRKSIHIVESIVNMAKTMSIPIIAEGVETREQVEFLESLGCRYIQGYFFYRPMPAEEFEGIIESGEEVDFDDFTCKTNEQIHMREFLDQNVYSDAMLNSVLGPVAIYLWHDDQVDIVRFNEQFYEAVGVPGFHDRLVDIGQFVPEGEKGELIGLFDAAAKDELNGAMGTIGFARPDGTVARFHIHCYYLGESSEGKRFYGSARDVTELAETRWQMRVLADHLSSTIVFAKQGADSWQFQVVVHGLENVMGVSAERLQRELDDGHFATRLEPGQAEELRMAVGECIRRGSDFACPFKMRTANGHMVPLQVRADHAKRSQSGITYILTFTEQSKLEKFSEPDKK